MKALAPSFWLRRLLVRVLRTSDEHILGDLEEEYRDRVKPSRSWLAAEMWYTAEATSLAFAVARGRFGLRGRPGRGKFEFTRGNGMMWGVGRDVIHALRGLRRERGTTIVIGLTLAVAVGATTAIFSVANAAFLKPLPYPDADRLVGVYTGFNENPGAALAVSPLDLRDFAGFDAVIEAAGAWSMGESVHMTDGDQPLRLVAPRASTELFRILGAQATVGRFFTADEEIPGQNDAVVLSHGLWTRAFGSDPQVTERSVMLDGRRYRVVGVAPEHGMLPRDADVWLPLALGPEWYEQDRWGWQFLGTVARLTPGTDVSSATRLLNARLAQATDRAERLGQTRVVRSLYDERSATTGPAILMLLSAVGLVLAMACANVMNVMLARSELRMREFSLRRALGSGAAPLARLVMLETGLLAGIGALGGIGIAHLGLEAVNNAELQSLAAMGPIGIDGAVLAFGLLVTLATAALFGAAPMLGALRAAPQVVLKETSSRGGSSRAANRARDGLVVMQVAIALTLLVAVGLSAGAFRTLVTTDPGFDPSGVLTATIEMPADGPTGLERSEFYRDMIAKLESITGVTSAGAANFLPLEGVGWSSSFEPVDMDPQVSDPDPGGNMRAVSAGYFTTLGIPLIEGREFTDADRPESGVPVAIVDETIARLFWPSGSPVGRQAIILGLARRPATIIGVVGDVPDESLGRPGPGHVYFPVLQSPQRRMTLVLKTASDPTALAPALRELIRTLDDRIPITELSTFDTRLSASLASPRIGLLLLATFGAAAALLAAVGIYGILAYTVARRTGEIGTRMALGAAPSVVRRSVVRRAMRLWLVGAAAGTATSLAAARVLERYVPSVDAASPITYVMAFSALALIALLAATIPARRATGVDPVEALRAE